MLTTEQEQLIITLDKQATCLLNKEGEEVLLESLPELLTSDLKAILRTSNSDELDRCCQQYPGFYQLMKVLGVMAQGISSGKIPVS